MTKTLIQKIKERPALVTCCLAALLAMGMFLSEIVGSAPQAMSGASMYMPLRMHQSELTENARIRRARRTSSQPSVIQTQRAIRRSVRER
jgi:hypothetical protein